MSINFSHSAEPEVMIDINTTPLIDVMLVLLVMLIITIPVQKHAVKLNLPQANTPPVAVPPPVDEVDIDFDGTVYWNGVVVPDPATLDARLKAAAVDPAGPEVHVNPNKLASYGAVIAVMAMAERDGVTKIGIVGNEQFAQ